MNISPSRFVPLSLSVVAARIVLVRTPIFETPFKQLLHYEPDSSFFIKAGLAISPYFPRQAISEVGLGKVNLEYLIFAPRIGLH